MSSSFTMVKDLDLSNEPQIWRIKVRIIKRWSISTAEDRYKKPILEFIVMDMLCSIKNPMRRLFENDIVEWRIIALSNFSLAVNDQKYKPTTHSHCIYFKRKIQIRPLEDNKFSDNVFHFVPNEIILGHDNLQSHLIDIIVREIRLSSQRMERNQFTSYSNLMTSRVRERFDALFGKNLQINWCNTCKIILQLNTCSLCNLQSLMGISNTNYNTILHINVDFQEVKDFRQSIIMDIENLSNQLSQIISDSSYSVEENFLRLTQYRPICELKDIAECDIYVTTGTVISIEIKFGWWYKGYKMFCIHLRVFDETDYALFIVYDKEASKFLGTTASDLCFSQVSRGVNKSMFPAEINLFKCKKFLFKMIPTKFARKAFPNRPDSILIKMHNNIET
ncbi:hypothetical protein Ahy_A10g048860 [Arachis hypogaea]|uniref:Replication protein A 70 kDa DNA-binding subunit B/D first OB fold domain-containing protein n=1 Tax=Arachis hypogaea TaxID=3818 RepID=A0A445B628_ARAHY|nr:hypothetical protein Ahy_A10g048860 [Arachis hypogaea]